MNWTQISKRGRLSVLPNVYSMEAVTTLTNQLLNNISYKKVLMALENRNMHIFVDTESLYHAKEKGIMQLRTNPKLFDHTIQEINILAKEWLQWLKTLNPEKKTNKELIEIYLKYREYYKEVYGRYFTIIILENPLTEYLQTILEKVPEEKRAQYFTTLTSTIEAMHNKKEERDRLQLALKIKKYNNANFLENPEIHAWIENHTENYFWLTRDYEDPHLTKQDFIKKIQQNLNEENLEKQAHEALHEEELHHKQIVAIEADAKLTVDEKEFFRIMRAGIYLKELRKSIVSQSLFHFDKVLNEICKRTNLTIELARMLLPHDLHALLIEKKPYNEILQKRFDKSVYLIQDGKYIAYTGKEAEKWFSKLIDIDKNVTEIKGIPASAGITKGPAKIILHPSDFHKIRDGDVMITVQAVPSFLQTIKKCKALVADGGTGITSHPATLAREAKIPCVIGAKIATNIIKDDEIVEVDGNTGTIKRLITNAENLGNTEKRTKGKEEKDKERKNKEEKNKKEKNKETKESKYNDLICVNDEPDMNVFSLGIVLQGLHRNAMKELVGFTIGPVTCEYINKRIIYRVPRKNYQEYGKKAFEKIQQDKNIIKRFFEEIKQCNKNVHNLKTTNKQEKFDAIYENLAHACMLGYFTVALELENQLLTNKVSEIITAAAARHSCERNPQEYFVVLTTQEQESASAQEHVALLELVNKIQKKQITKAEAEKKLKSIHKTYCWSMHGYNGPAKSKEMYKEQLNILLEKNAETELENIENEKQELQNKQKEFLSELKLNKEEIYFIDCLKYTTATKIVRKDMMAYTSWVLFELFEEKRNEHNITIDEMQFITPYEARELLVKNKVPSKKELQQRLKHCLYLFDDPQESFLYEDEAKKFLKKHVAEEKIEQVSELKGMAAYLGKVTGRAVIVNTKEDMHKIQQGDILVSYATSPEILPAMKKAAAFVTDHGGATCHAAIVAREMKKPCIIGTKYATKIIKDNDIVEVDAYTGIVKKIESNKQTKEIQWKEVASDFNSPLMRNHIWTKAWTVQKKIFGVPLMQSGVKCERNAIKYIADTDTWAAAHHAFRKMLEADAQWIHNIIEKTNELGEATNNWSEQCFVKKKVGEYNSGQLCILLDEYIEKQAIMYAYGLIMPLLDFQDFSYVEGNLKKILKEKIPQQYNEAYNVFTAPLNNSFQQDQEEALLELTKKFYSEQWKKDMLTLTSKEVQAKYPQFWKKLEAHTNKHAWVYYVYQGPAFTENEFMEFIQLYLKKEETPAQQLEEIEKNKNKIKNKKQEFLKKIQLTYFEKNILLLAGKVVWAKPRRKDYQSKTYYHVENLYREIGRRVGCTLQEARSADPDALKNALQTGTLIDREKIKETQEFHIVIPDKNKEAIIFSGKKAREFHEKIEKEKDAQHEQKNDELKGTCACPGNATGNVKIINSPEDMSKMQQGDILVSVATTPSIVPAMKKAAAIITNEGGITCHAAIVSRELNIPCITGTKNATKLLKDNDRVEVDASAGIITRKIHDTKSKYIAWFSELNNKEVPLVGGKGASLGEMFNIMPVPNGFCITVNSYKEALASILPEINEILKTKIQDIDDLQNKENVIKAKIHAIQIPKLVEQEIRACYKQLGGKVAVRSSATTEDLDDASFAGQQDSYLNIEGEEAVCEAVKKCWASLFNARAIQYREEKKFNHDDAYLAVVIQKMVDAEKAGVLFTANPINNATTEMIIEACFGLGEKLVSGEITPDTFIIDKKAATVKQEYLNHETKTLQENELRKLIELAKKIEQHYGKPMDIEWAIEKGEVYILQARPITTIETEQWISNFSIENAGSQLLHPALHSAFKYAMEVCFDKKKHLTQFLAIMDGVHLKNACVKEKEIQNLVNATIQKITEEPEKIKEIHKQAYVYNDEYLKQGKKYININFSNITDKELAKEYTTLLNIQNKAHGQALITTWFVDSYQEKFSKLLIEKVQNLCKNTKKDVAETFSILTTLPKNSLATIEEIESLTIVQKIQQSDETEIILNWQNTTQIPECSFKEEMEAHYQKWCWMPFSYIGPAYDREFYIEIWKGLLKENFNAKKRMQELQQRPEKIKKQQKALITELKIDKETQTILEIGADIAFLKGYRKDIMYHGMYALSFILKEAARRLHVPLKDMYLLTDTEIYNALMNQAPIDSAALYERKERHCFVFDYETGEVEEYRGKQAEEFLKSKKFVEEKEEVQVDILKGTTACSGIAKGIVKIINQPRDMKKMDSGNILVAHTTMPSLLPAMKKAAAIITEDGGITCHAAIVSRELKIPCVTGIKTATKVLKDGMTVEVDASEGIVKII